MGKSKLQLRGISLIILRAVGCWELGTSLRLSPRTIEILPRDRVLHLHLQTL